MKLILIILLCVPCFLKAQVDTVGVITYIKCAGTFNIDTIKVENNKCGQFELYLTGVTTIVNKGVVTVSFQRAKKSFYITNMQGIVKVTNNSAGQITFTGLTGGGFDVIVVNGLALVKITGTPAITEWKLTRLNL